MSPNRSSLEQFADEHDGTLDSLSLDTLDDLEQKLKKAATMEQREIDSRADTLRGEVLEAIDADAEPDAGGQGGDDPDTLSATAAAEYLQDHDLETLNSVWEIEDEVDTLSRKRTTFETRDMENRVAEIDAEIAALQAAKAEIQQTDKTYEDRDTLAKRAVGDHLVIETHSTADGMSWSTRRTGGSK